MTALDIEKKLANRLRLLYEIYKTSTVNPVNANQIGANIGLKNGVFKDAHDYLIGEGYVEVSNDIIGSLITHEGKKLIEAAILNKDEGQSSFPPLSEVL